MVKKKRVAVDFTLPEDFGPTLKFAIQKGQLVRSLAGRDKDKYYLVLGRALDVLYLADGRNRGAKNPKKKNIRHVQRCNRIAADVVAAAQGRLLRDEEIRAGLHELLADELS
jgi:ribosomal protein L14E/L6E/L27E